VFSRCSPALLRLRIHASVLRLPILLSSLVSACRRHRDLHSFPTRRSSDLGELARMAARAAERTFTEHTGDARALELLKHLEAARSEEHTSELQSHLNLVCRLLLEKKKDAELACARLHSEPHRRDSATHRPH